MEFTILNSWDGKKDGHDPITITIQPDSEDQGLVLRVKAPFYNIPPSPRVEPGQSCPQLWNYEVVEVFFLNDATQQYLEVELCPHGQYLVLLLEGSRNVKQSGLPLEFRATIDGSSWNGEALIPWCYLPPSPTRFNAYAIHGECHTRIYRALHPVPGCEPDFHRLHFFGNLDLRDMMDEVWIQPISPLWSPLPKHTP
uniref:Uncharacterized protein n=1 Tax=Eptatretus burgeri TaxID=7764 RepID=A0A8C4R7Z1_EPTBU